MDIRACEPADAWPIVELWRKSFEHGVGIEAHHPIEEQHAHFLATVVPGNSVKVVLVGRDIVAFIASTPESISQLFARMANLCRGIGFRWLALAKAGSSGSLWLYTVARNTNARRFCERHDFHEVERESENMWRLEAIRYVWRRSEGAA